MKRYIRASISSTVPSWLRKKLEGNKWNKPFLEALMKKYRIAIDRANFTDHPTSSSDLKFYLLDTDYGTEVYVPGVNDDTTAYINGRNRKLGSIAKSKLDDMAEDVVYLDPFNQANLFEKKERYQDPRYSYYHNSKGSYAGQYQRKPYLGDNKYGDPEWTKTGQRPNNERANRDKSGYRVPTPEEMIAQYYSKFPERVTNKVDKVYDEIVDVKQLLMDADINSPVDRDNRYDRSISNAYRYFSDVINEYRDLLTSLKDDRTLNVGHSLFGDDYAVTEFSKRVSNIRSRLAEIRQLLGY